MSCPDCFSGSVHDENPTGTTTTIHGLPVYVAQPPQGVTPKGLVVMIPDAFGWDLPNNRALADRYAERGRFLVYLPDFMNGHSAPISMMSLLENKIMKPASWFDTIFYKPFYIIQVMSVLIPWLFYTRRSVCKPIITGFFQALRTSPPPFTTKNLKIGAAGFCWGGYHTIALLQDVPDTRVCRHESQIHSTGAEPLIDCGFTAHPSWVKVPDDIEAVKFPLSVAVGNEDSQMKGPKILQMKEILEVKKKGDHEVNILPGAKHGFAIRGLMTDELQKQYAEKAEVQAVDWFTRWLA